MSVYNDEVLLVHIPKCGGTSCRDYMKAHLRGVVDSLSREGGPLPIDSTPLRHISEYTGRPLDSWEKILIPVRDPYAQIVSQWSYWWDRYAKGGRHIHDRAAALYPNVEAWLTDPHSDFRVWYLTHVRQEYELHETVMKVRETGYYEYFMTTEDGELPENVVVIPLDKLSERFPEELAPYLHDDGGPFPHKRSSPHGDNPMLYLSPPAVQEINLRFRWTFREKRYFPEHEMVYEGVAERGRDIECPQCGTPWPVSCDHADAIREYGKCISCMVDGGEPPYGVPGEGADR